MRYFVIVSSAALASVAEAQGPTAADVLRSATEIVATLEMPEQCDISLHGTPVLDDVTARWLIAYSGVGPACDDASAALQRVGVTANIAFFRRPNSDEIKREIARMRASVRQGFDCLISFNGDLRFDDESNLWTVRYYASGQQCNDAAEELERQGKALRLSFQRFR
jgi:hypothetical protein